MLAAAGENGGPSGARRQGRLAQLVPAPREKATHLPRGWDLADGLDPGTALTVAR